VKTAKLWLLLSLLFVTVMGLYFAFNPSYERSLQAKFYYTLGDYKTAHTLARESFALDSYNRMAATVMTQSQTALKFVDYIAEAKRYSADIAAMADAETISGADRAKMKLICEVMMESFVKISPIRRDGRSVVIDRALIEEAKGYYEQFVALHAKLSQTL
jgi:hypothetical protein